MKNKDVLAMEKAKIVEKMNQAIKDDDTKAFSETFTELCQKIEDNVLEQGTPMMTWLDQQRICSTSPRQTPRRLRQA